MSVNIFYFLRTEWTDGSTARNHINEFQLTINAMKNDIEIEVFNHSIKEWSTLNQHSNDGV